MKKDKLYTVNRFNRTMFKPNENLFAGPFGNSQMQIGGYNPLANLNPQQMAQLKAFNLSAMSPKLSTSSSGLGTIGNIGGMGSLTETDPTKFFGLESGSSPKEGLFSKANLSGALSSAGTGLATSGIGMLGDMAGNAISGGLTSEAGDIVGSVGSAVLGAAGTAIGGPIGGAIGSAVGSALGGLTNKMVGSKLNQENINKVENTISGLTSSANALGNASTAEDLLSSWGNTDMGFDFNNSFIGKDGWFSSKAKRKANELRRRQNEARGLAINALGTGAENVDEMQDANILANTIAFGGNLFDFGGDLQTHGGDYPTGLTHISAGGSHEENPYDGVQMGVDREGVPNLVEEGETVYNDYVFSNRILADETTKKLLHLPKKKNITFAEISKKLEKEIAERPNDPISKAGFEAQMQTLEEQQERQKSEMEAERARAAFEALTPEEQTALMQQKAQQEAMAQQTAMQQPSPEEVQMMQQQAIQADGSKTNRGTVLQMAEGGKINRFDDGGGLEKWLKENHPEIKAKGYALAAMKVALGENGKDYDKAFKMVQRHIKDADAGNEAASISELMDMFNPMDELIDLYTPEEVNVPSPEELERAEIEARRNIQRMDIPNAQLSPASFTGSKVTPNLRQPSPIDVQYQSMDGYSLPPTMRDDGTQVPDGIGGQVEGASISKAIPNTSYEMQPDFLMQSQMETGYPGLYRTPIRETAGAPTAVEKPVNSRGQYLWDKFWSPINEYSKKRGNNKNKYQVDKTYKGNIKELENSDSYKAFTDYILNGATDEERQNYFKWIDDNTGRENKYLDKEGKLIEGWQDAFTKARNDGLYGIQHYTPELMAAQEEVSTITPEKAVVTPEVKMKTPAVTSGTSGATVNDASTTDKVAPILKAEWPRYVGLFGPAVGLGMMAAGVGKPDYSKLDAALEHSGDVTTAGYKPIGNYLTYRPMDIWFEQNRMDANARATDRAIMNSASPSRMAGLLASGYNNQIADGELYRKALEYNDAKRAQVGEFNRGTDMFNAQAYNQNQQFNADARNRARQYRASLAMQAATEKLNRDAGWYNSLYGNISGLFRGLSDLGRENAQWNMISRGAADGVYGNLGDSWTGQKVIKRKAEGGKVRKKKGLTY